MPNRIITAAVSGEKIKLSNRLAGASGSHNAVSLSLTFDSAWDGTTKKVYFFDRDGENAVFRLLTADLLVSGAYIVPIPSEPLAKSGDMTITIRGVEMVGATAERIIMSASTTMKVDEAVTPDSDVAPIEPTPTQAEQLQGQIDVLLGEISAIPASVQAAQNSATAAAGSAAAAESSRVLAEAARTGAEAARDSAQGTATAFDSHAASLKSGFDSNAAAANTTIDGKVTIATNAATAAQTAQGLSEGARDASIAAKNEAITAKTAAETAQSLAQTAKTGADTAKAGADAARTGAESARDTAVTAKNDAVIAKNDAQSAQTAAETAKGQAETARAGAQTAATTAGNRALDSEAFGAGTRSGAAVTVGDPAFQNNAKWYKEQAAEIVGGDYPTKTEAQGYVSTHDASGTAHSALLGNKVDKVAGKGLSTEDYTTAEKTKLAGIATGANNYTHPANHPPSIIAQDAGNRFVTDTEKSTWNGKANASHTHTKANITDFAHKSSHTTGGSDALTAADIGAASRTSGTATLAVASWVGTAAPYTYELALPGITADDVLDIHAVDGMDKAAADLIKEAWGKAIGYVDPDTGTGKVTFYASEKPAVAIPIYWRLIK